VTAREAQVALQEGNALNAGGEVQAAIAAYRRALGHHPGFGAAHYNLGVALRRARDWRGAALAFLDAGDFDAVQSVGDTLAEAVRAGDDPFPAAPVRARADGPREGVSIVVCSIDAAKLARMQASFGAALAGRDHEFIVIRDARSLAEAYTRGLALCRHEWVVFSHDDVELASERPFDAIAAALRESDVVGVAGSRLVSGPAVMWAGHPHVHGWVAHPAKDAATAWDASFYSLEGGPLRGMQALDGLLFATRREVVRRVGFDAHTFDGFHFYDLDFTYRAYLQGLRLAVTTDAIAIHASAGHFGEAWKRYAERFGAKFPALRAPAGAHHAYGVRLHSTAHLLGFYRALRGLGDSA
jgi:hypothetical protein